MGELLDFLPKQAQGDLLSWASQVSAAEHFGLTYRQVEEAALQSGLLPARYRRNRTTISVSQQLQLFRSRVAVIGCGGLGGYAIEELARLGVGHLTVVDPDVFEEHNLNRQVLSSLNVLGKDKVSVAAERVRDINPAVEVIPNKEALNTATGPRLLQGAGVVVDALDSISGRLVLADVCNELGIPVVHGTIAGWYGQVTSQFPGDNTMRKIYSRCLDDKGVETTAGNPAFTPATIASIQVAEVCKILLGLTVSLRHKLLSINLLDMEMEMVNF